MLKPGDSFPSTCIGLKNRDIDLRDRFLESAGLLIGSIGAFHPVDTTQLIPGYKDAAERLKESGVGFIACLAVNDPYVLRAWARRMKIVTELTFISDVNALLSQALGMHQLMPAEGFGNALPRCQRFAMLVGKGATVLAVGLGEEAFSDRFLPKVFKIMGITEEGATSEETVNTAPTVSRTHQRLSIRQPSDVSSKSGAASSRHPAPPRLSFPPETWYPVEWLLPFRLLFHNCINDTDNEHIVFDYSQSSLCDSYVVGRVGGRLELSPNLDDDFGTVMVDYMRPIRAIRRMGLSSVHESISDEACDLLYNIKKVIITSEQGLIIETPLNSNLYADYNYGIGTTGALIVVVHELSTTARRTEGSRHDVSDTPKYLVVVLGLHAGGRDPLLANIQGLLPLETGQQVVVNRKDLADENQGLGISQYVAPRDRFYSFKAPLPFEKRSSDPTTLATWFVAAEKAYASEEQLRGLRSLFEEGPKSRSMPMMEEGAKAPELMFFTACDCQ